MRYLVTWSIDVDDAETPEGAAYRALDTMHDINPYDAGGANVFTVTDNETGRSWTVDLGHQRSEEINP